MSARGAGLISLTNDPAEDGGPAWSPDGKLSALWTDGVAVESDPGIAVALTLRSFSAQRLPGIEVLQGVEQDIMTNREGEDVVIRAPLVKDYPMIPRLSA